MKVPFLDLKAHHAPLIEKFDRAIREVIESSAFAGGPFVERFEEEFATFCGSPYAIGVGNGTDALWLTLLALGIGEGDEVITVPNTFIATAEAITYCKARPVFVDVDQDTFTMNPAELEKSLTERTKAIIPVHLFGQPSDMDSILEFARANGLFVVEDAAQAHGAEYKGRKAGTMGDAGCFSFYPGKNLGAFGEAGAVVTNDPELRKQIQMLRDHGQSRKYYHTAMGWNCRMDGIQAAVLSIKLGHLDEANSLRRKHALEYNQAFAGIDEVFTPFEATLRAPRLSHLCRSGAGTRRSISTSSRKRSRVRSALSGSDPSPRGRSKSRLYKGCIPNSGESRRRISFFADVSRVDRRTSRIRGSLR